MKLETARLILRPLSPDDADALLAYERRNRERFAPHGPRMTDEDMCREACAGRIAQQLAQVEAGLACRWLLRPRTETSLVIGHVAITAIQRGVRQAGSLGYGVDAAHEGCGLMREALEVALAHAFGPLKLHRVEANHRPENSASAGLLARMGFVREGFARQYIRLDGEWTDVVLTGLCNPDWHP